MGVLIWLTISLVCLITFIVANRWGKWIESYGDTGPERFAVAILCLMWPCGLLVFICLIMAKLMERFLP